MMRLFANAVEISTKSGSVKPLEKHAPSAKEKNITQKCASLVGHIDEEVSDFYFQLLSREERKVQQSEIAS